MCTTSVINIRVSYCSKPSKTAKFEITCMHASAMQCVKGHVRFRGETLNFDPPWLAHPCTDQHKIWHIWLPRGYDLPNPIWCKSGRGGRLGNRVKYTLFGFLGYFFPFVWNPYIDQNASRDFRRWWLIWRDPAMARTSTSKNQGKHSFLGSFAPKTPQFWGWIGNSHYKETETKSVITLKRMIRSSWNFQETFSSGCYVEILQTGS